MARYRHTKLSIALPRVAAAALITLLCAGQALADTRDAERAIRMQDYPKAFVLYQQAATAGDAEAQYQLSNLYALGKGTSASDANAKLWLERAANQNHPAALYTLALQIGESNPSRSDQLMRSSAEQGYSAAKRYLAMHEMNDGQDRSVVESASSSVADNWFGAARANQIDQLAKLLASGVDINLKDSAGRTAVFTAIEFDNSEALKWLLAKGADPNQLDNAGVVPIFYAINSGNPALVKALLDQSADRQVKNQRGDSLLHYSLRLKKYDLVPLLIESSAPLNAMDAQGLTALDLAQNAEIPSLVSLLSSKGATHSETWKQQTANGSQQNRLDLVAREMDAATLSSLSFPEVVKIAMSGNTALVRRSVEARPELLTMKTGDGETMLTAAIRADQMPVVQALLKAGADPNFTGPGGTTPLQVTAQLNRSEIIEELLSRGADPTLRDAKGFDAVDRAIQQRHLAASQMLLRQIIGNKQKTASKPDFDRYLLLATQAELYDLYDLLAKQLHHEAQDSHSRNAIWFAASKASDSAIDRLIKLGILANQADQDGKTALMVAAENGCLKCARQLAEYDDVNRQSVSGTTALMLAVRSADAPTVSWLLSAHAEVETRNSQGNTALILAVESGNAEITKLLVDAGASPSRKNNLGYSALDIAELNHPDIYNALKAKSFLGIF